MEAPGILPNGFQKILNSLIKQFVLIAYSMSDTMQWSLVNKTNKNFCLDGVKVLEEEHRLISEIYGMSGSAMEKINWVWGRGGGIASFLTEPIRVRIEGLGAIVEVLDLLR